MKICVIGQGYIGIPTALILAKNNNTVVGVDINSNIINSLKNAILPIDEEGLQELLVECINNKTYHANLKPETADAYIITVPTPYKKDTYECDLTYVISACESILPVVKKGNTVIVESTISPLSMDRIIKPFFEKNGFNIGVDLFLVHCPERVIPGDIINELINNNRIIGGVTPLCSEKAELIYGSFVKGNIIKTDARTAEFSKCIENTFRDVNIAFANEIVKICSKININALDVIAMANKHPRVNIHAPGPGVGGHCLAIDPYFIYANAPNESKIIKLSRETNESMPNFVVKTIEKIITKHNLVNPKISILGLAYKGNVDDDRESPSYSVLSNLKTKYDVYITDSHIKNSKTTNFKECIKDSSLIVILTDHNEYKNMDLNKILEMMSTPIILDTKNILDSKKIPENMILYNFGNLYEIKN